MQFDILTIFPHILDSYINESILKIAQEKGLIHIAFHNIRDYSLDKHKNVDDAPYGGGPGMVMRVEPIYRCLVDFLGQGEIEQRIANLETKVKYENVKIVLLSAGGEQFTQKKALQYSKTGRLVLIAGRYEGVDARVENFVDDVVSIGPYVISGGELPAMVIVESVARLVPGVLGSEESLREESHGEMQKKEYPQYTRPEVFLPVPGIKWKVPEVLLSGDHKKIKKWREGKMF